MRYGGALEEGKNLPTRKSRLGVEKRFQKTDVSSLNDLRNLMNKAVETYQGLTFW